MDTGSGRDTPLPVRQAAQGDEEAFAAVVRRMAPMTHALVQQYDALGLDREDLVQECMLGLLAAVRSYRPEGGAAFTTYAATCMRNRLASLARRYGSRAQREQPLETEDEFPDPQDGDPAVRMQQQEDAVLWQQLLRRRLTPLEYRVLLSRLSCCSYEETAQQLGITKKAVDNAVQRLRRKLSAQL